MKIMTAAPIISNIEKKIARLIAENRRLRGEREKWVSAREKLREENAALALRAAEAERRVAVLELRQGFEGGGERVSNKAARARVNRLMREIDKCIALVGKQ
jgi:phage shock protein A